MYEWMQEEEGEHPNAYAIVSLLKAWGSTGNLVEAKHVHVKAVKCSVCPAGQPVKALQLYAEMLEEGITAEDWTFVQLATLEEVKVFCCPAIAAHYVLKLYLFPFNFSTSPCI